MIWTTVCNSELKFQTNFRHNVSNFSFPMSGSVFRVKPEIVVSNCKIKSICEDLLKPFSIKMWTIRPRKERSCLRNYYKYNPITLSRIYLNTDIDTVTSTVLGVALAVFTNSTDREVWITSASLTYSRRLLESYFGSKVFSLILN